MSGFSYTLSVALSSAAAFVSTELDDFFILLILFARCQTRGQKVLVSVGKYFSLALVAVGSALFAKYLQKIPPHFIGFLGIVPFALGIRDLFKKKRDVELSEKNPFQNSVGDFSVLVSSILIPLGCSGDNFAVYIPFFTSTGGWGYLICGIIFFVLQLLMLILAALAIRIADIGQTVKKLGRILIPVLMILLGIYIFWKNGTISWITKLGRH